MPPYRTDLSASPQERQPSISPPVPDPVTAAKHGQVPTAGGRDGPGPSKRPKLTQSDIQRMQVEKLLANPDREVALPAPVKEKTLRAPYEMMKNVQGSAAGAGSGEFHVYKASRRREYERIKLMEDKGRELEEQEAFRARQDAREAAADAKTAKNRAKRAKRKGGGGGGKKDGTTGEPVGPAKRKLAGGAEGFQPPRPAAEEGDESDDEPEREVRELGVGNLGVPIPTENGAMGENGGAQAGGRAVVDEANVVIHDDD